MLENLIKSENVDFFAHNTNNLAIIHIGKLNQFCSVPTEMMYGSLHLPPSVIKMEISKGPLTLVPGQNVT